MSANENAKKLIKALGAKVGEDIANAHVTQASAEIGLEERPWGSEPQPQRPD